MYDSIVIGCGFAGAVVARELAERKNKKVLVLEKREHIGGNSYDFYDEHGILIHKYGPHIFHTNYKRVYEYLSRFTEFSDYRHEVVSNIKNKLVPVPFNLNSLYIVYGDEKAKHLEDKLISEYGLNSRVPILLLMENEDDEIKAIAEYIYQNIFFYYTMKQWGKPPKELDKTVMERVPILISYDNRYFQDTYQGMPKISYTKLFENLLEHEGVTVKLNTNAKDTLEFINDKVYFNGEVFKGEVIYTGALDELFDCEYGRLPYRSLHFATEYYEKEHYQTHGVVNYTVSEDFTRITEYKYLTGQKSEGTVIMKEYPMEYCAQSDQLPYYAINNDENQALYEKYANEVKNMNNFYLLGRLAEYKYYNIDAIVLRALELADQLIL